MAKGRPRPPSSSRFVAVKANTKAKANAKSVVAVAKATTMLEAETAQSTATKARGRASEDDRSAIKKYLVDHFAMLTNEEKFVKLVNGMTLETRLLTDRELWKAGELKMGFHYYAEKRRVYGSEGSAFKQIVIEDEGQEDDEALDESLYLAGKHLVEAEQLLLWLAQERLPNQKTLRH